MLDKNIERAKRLNKRRKQRVRSRITGSEDRMRISVFRSTRHLYVQVINDLTHNTVASVSSFGQDVKGNANTERCKELGVTLAKRCQEKGISRVVFDRNGKLYHGRVKALAEGMRSAGLEF